MSDEPIIAPFTVEDYLAIGGQNFSASVVSMREGPAWTLRDGESILAVGGVRVSGIGQAWLMLSDRGRSRPKSVLRACDEGLHKAIVDHGLYRIYAEPSVDNDHFFERWFVRLQPNERLFVWPKIQR